TPDAFAFPVTLALSQPVLEREPAAVLAFPQVSEQVIVGDVGQRKRRRSRTLFCLGFGHQFLDLRAGLRNGIGSSSENLIRRLDSRIDRGGRVVRHRFSLLLPSNKKRRDPPEGDRAVSA